MSTYIDLDTMSVRELKALKRRLEVAIETRDERIKRAKAATKIQTLARNMGYSVEELFDQPKIRQNAKVAPKYRNPANPEQTWSGRGRQPIWIRELEAAGTPIEDLLINK